MFTIIQTLELVCTFTLLCIFANTLLKKGVIISVKWCAYCVFIVFFVLPNLIMIVNWPLNIQSYGYHFIENDSTVEMVYTAFIMATSAVLRKSALKSQKKSLISLNAVRELKLRIPLAVIFITFVGTLLPLFAAILSPQPELYFLSFAPFSRTNVYTISAASYNWHSGYMSVATKIAMLSVVVLWYAIQKATKTNKFVGKIYLFIVAAVILLFSSKRTLGILLLLIMMIIEILNSKTGAIKKIVFYGGLSVFYFVLYQSIVKKTVGGGVSTITEMYIIYFSRILDFRYVTYSILHPDNVRILDYPCQSFLFDILPFIKRSVWADKPYPFGVYYTAAWNNQAVSTVSYRYTVSWFAEAFANLSWMGIPIGVWLYKRMLDLFERFQNPIVSVFSIYVAVYFMVTHVQSNFSNVGILAFLYFFIERRYRRKQQIYNTTVVSQYDSVKCERDY